MARVEVSRLAMACPVQYSAAPRIRLEDALQCEIPDDDRLVLIRRMAISAGASAPRAGARQQAMRSAWQAATDGARHGSESGAPAANCVWFASEAEAEVVLLDLMLRGCAPVGWFWKLAVPNWRARPVNDWLPELVAEAILPGREAKLVRLIACCGDCGAANQLIAALPVAAAMGSAPDSAVLSEPANVETASAQSLQSDLASTVAAEALRQFPAAVRDALRAVQSSTQGAAAVRAVLRAQVLRVSPALTMRPMLLAEILARTEAALHRPATAAKPDVATEPETGRKHRSKAKPIERGGQDRVRPASSAPSDTAMKTATAPLEPVTDRLQQARVDELEPQILPSLLTGRALRSGHAGVWLAVPALADLGFRGWLQDRPELLGNHPGAQLITAIARHHGCAADDPALSGLPRLDPDQPCPEWTDLWRLALDRWLRRTARRRLHDLARRPGKLLWSDDRLQITFPLAAADIRLRRLALDRDPGWTDWLGLSVRFSYSDEARG